MTVEVTKQKRPMAPSDASSRFDAVFAPISAELLKITKKLRYSETKNENIFIA